MARLTNRVAELPPPEPDGRCFSQREGAVLRRGG